MNSKTNLTNKKEGKTTILFTKVENNHQHSTKKGEEERLRTEKQTSALWFLINLRITF